MWPKKVLLLLLLCTVTNCQRDDSEDVSGAFVEAAKSLFNDKDTIDGLQSIASAFVQSDTGKQVGEMLTNGKVGDVSQTILKLGKMLMSGAEIENDESNMITDSGKKVTKDTNNPPEVDIDFSGLINIGSMLLGQKRSSEALMGFLPMIMEMFVNGGDSSAENFAGTKAHDHSGHAWFMPPILENIHVMWEHFRNSELAQALWTKSGLNKIVAQMTDERGNIQFEKILDTFENPMQRRRWIKSLTNFVAEWISYVSDANIRQRYLNTAQFVTNSFLKSQGFPKTVMFDSNKPSESLSRLVNALVKKNLGMKFDSSQYVKPAVAYVQELMSLASEKGFIMSKINARELSNKLSDTINDDFVAPILKAYRAYKWAVKIPQCASQILCTINEKKEGEEVPLLRSVIAKVSSFPAAWAVSNKLDISFWSLYGAIMDNGGCINKYPAECTVFHEEEIRVTTTESVHSEL